MSVAVHVSGALIDRYEFALFGASSLTLHQSRARLSNKAPQTPTEENL